MSRDTHDGVEGSLVVDALERMVESLPQFLTQSLEGVREAARREALRSERRRQEALRRAEKRLQRAMRKNGHRAEDERAEGATVLLPSAEGSCVTREEHLQLERRVMELEVSIKTALDSAFSRLETLVQQLEERSPPETSTTPSSAPPSAAVPPAASSNRTPPSRRSSSTSAASPSSTAIQQDDSQGSAMIGAVRTGELEAVRRLLDEGANVNCRDSYGLTLLHMAAAYEQANVVRLLVERGADASAVSRHGDTTLHCAAIYDTTGLCVEALNATGADVNALNDRGWTPLHYASVLGKERSARSLLAAGAKKTVRDNEGRTPCEISPSHLREILRT